MTIVKPKANHPWRSAIKADVQVIKIQERISELKEHIRMLQIEIKMNETKLNELKVGNGKQ
jgi:hypothetical protein